jgi:hypothetical protein
MRRYREGMMTASPKAARSRAWPSSSTFTLVALGAHLFGNLGIEDLVRTAGELGRWELLFTGWPHAVPNGAGSAMNPIAVF